jgi:SAM-dependent methyltransferase
MTREKAKRLRSEAMFQSVRESGKVEPQDRFSYLVNRASTLYFNALLRAAGTQTLVVGCATGTVTPLAKRGFKTIGIDICSDAIAKLNLDIERKGLQDLAEARVMDAEETDFPPASFDLICCSGVLHHLDIRNALKEWVRLLSSAGRLVLLEPMQWNPFAAVYRAMTPDQRTADEHPLRPMDIALVKRHFGDVRITPVNLTTPLSAIFAYTAGTRVLREASATLLRGLDAIIFKMIPPSRYVAWSVLIEGRNPRN